ncbi:MAG: AMP-binding protein [Nitriliruptoraceae bacterium]
MGSKVTVVSADPQTLPTTLRSAWDAGSAVLVLPVDAVAARGVLRSVADLPPDMPSTLPFDLDLDIPDDTALIVATSGSTAAPKGVVLSHRAVTASTTASLARLGARQGEVFTLALPLHHVAGIQILLRSWACGTDAEILTAATGSQLAAAHGDHISLVPTQLARLIDSSPELLARWRSVLVGGAALRPALGDNARAHGARLVASYGMTETAGGCVYDGQPLDGVDIDVIDGRIHVRGPVLFSGYLIGGTFEPAPSDGWTTPDVGTFDEAGHLVVLGRADDIVVSGGENIPTGLVTSRLIAHPAVADATAFGVDDAEWGQQVVAAVVPADPSNPPSADALTSWIRQDLAAAWAPRRYLMIDRLPRTAMGKPDVATLRDLA